MSLGGIIYDEFGSDITIINTTFVNNSAGDSCFTSGIAGSIVYANSHGSSVEIYNSKFVKNAGVLICEDNCNMLTTHTKFIDNSYSGFYATLHTIDTNLVISYSTFINNTAADHVLDMQHTNISISYSEFTGNNANYTRYASGGMNATIDRSKFIRIILCFEHK